MKCCWTVIGALLQPGTSPTHYTAPISGFNGAQCSLSVSEPQASYRPSIVPMSPKINKVSSHLTATSQSGLSVAAERCSTVSTTDRKKKKNDSERHRPRMIWPEYIPWRWPEEMEVPVMSELDSTDHLFDRSFNGLEMTQSDTASLYARENLKILSTPSPLLHTSTPNLVYTCRL